MSGDKKQTGRNKSGQRAELFCRMAKLAYRECPFADWVQVGVSLTEAVA